jgi:hypothetical protein
VVSSLLPGTNNKPQELSVYDRAEIVKGTERYLPRSLLGYDFLNRGLMAEASFEGATLQVFLLQEIKTESASAVFDRYRSELALGKIEHLSERVSILEGVDPLYGPVVVIRKGNCLAGALKYSTGKGVRTFLQSLCR